MNRPQIIKEVNELRGNLSVMRDYWMRVSEDIDEKISKDACLKIASVLNVTEFDLGIALVNAGIPEKDIYPQAEVFIDDLDLNA